MLFKEVSTKNLPEDTSAYDAIKRYVSTFQANLDWETILPITENAELQYLVPAIGQALYDRLEQAYNDYPGSVLPTPDEKLIRKLQRSLAFYTLHLAGPELLTLTANIGMKESQDADGTALPPRQWAYVQTRRHAFKQGNLFLDQALAYLEANAADFSEWTDSDEYSKAHDLFFNSAIELEEYLPCNSSRLVYCQLRPYIRQAERRYIIPTIGQELHDELKTAILDRDISTDQSLLIQHIREALANWMQVCAIPHLRLTYEEGIVELAFSDGIYRKEVSREETTRSLWIALQDAGHLFLQVLSTWLQQNAALFPTFLNSSLYSAPTATTDIISEDEGYQSIVPFG